jgi:hypothetical protein
LKTSPAESFLTDCLFQLRQVKEHVLDDLVSRSLVADRKRIRGAPIERRFIEESGRRGSNLEISLLGRQVVAKTPLAWHNQPLQAD